MGGWTEQDVYWTPLCKDVWGLIYTPSHIKQRKALKSNKHFDTCWVVKRECLITDCAPTTELLENISHTGETNRYSIEHDLYPVNWGEKNHNKTVYSPLAIRLRTESELCTDGLSPCVVMVLTATADEESAVLKERYSCIIYRGYLLRWLLERFLNAKLVSRPVWFRCPWVEKTIPKEQRRKAQKTVCTLASILSETHEIYSNERETKLSFLPPAGLRLK